MTLTVETGVGIADADSYVSLVDAAAIAAKYGIAFSTTDQTAAEQILRRAASWLDGQYSGRFLGYRRLGRLQGREWPRDEAQLDRPPYDVISNTEVPTEVKRAQVEVAAREQASPGSLSPDVVAGKIIRSVAVEGAVSVTYATGGVQDQRPTLTVLDEILYPVMGQPTGSLFGSSGRR